MSVCVCVCVCVQWVGQTLCHWRSCHHRRLLSLGRCAGAKAYLSLFMCGHAALMLQPTSPADRCIRTYTSHTPQSGRRRLHHRTLAFVQWRQGSRAPRPPAVFVLLGGTSAARRTTHTPNLIFTHADPSLERLTEPKTVLGSCRTRSALAASSRQAVCFLSAFAWSVYNLCTIQGHVWCAYVLTPVHPSPSPLSHLVRNWSPCNVTPRKRSLGLQPAKPVRSSTMPTITTRATH